MSSQNINNLISDFNQNANEAKSHLTSILTVVSEGRVPSKEEMTVLGVVIDSLQEKYHCICNVTKSIVSEDDFPPEHSPVSYYANALEMSRVNALKVQLANAKKALEEFVGVKSLISEYSNILAPFQVKAAETLKQLTVSGVDGIDHLLSEAKAPQVFIEALNLDSIHAPEGNQLLEEVSRHYPKQVQWGLAGRQYFLGDKVITGNKDHLAPRAQQSPTSTANISEIESIKAKNKIKTTTPSASAFRRDITGLSRVHPSIRMILPLMTNLGVLSLEQILIFSGYMDYFDSNDESGEEVRKSLDALSAKGLLTLYEYPDGEDEILVYCLSPYCNACMRKESIASQMKTFWEMSYGSNLFVGDAEISRNSIGTIIDNNKLLLRYLDYAKNSLNGDEFRAIISSIRWTGSHYRVSLFFEDEQYWSSLINVGAGADADALPDTDILYISEVKAISGLPHDTVGRVFVLEDGTLHLHNSGDKPSEHEVSSSLSSDSCQSSDLEADEDKQEIEERPLSEEVPIVVAAPAQGDEPGGEFQPGEFDGSQPKEESSEREVSSSMSDDSCQSSDLEPDDEEQEVDERPSSEEVPIVVEIPVQEDEPEEGSQPGEFDENKVEIKTTLQAFLDFKNTPADSEFRELILSILQTPASSQEDINSIVVNALLLADCASLEAGYKECKSLSDQLQLATGLFIREHSYTSEHLASIFEDPAQDNPCLLLGAYLRAMLAPARAYDYGLKSQVEMVFSQYEMYFKGLSDFKPLFSKLMSVRDVNPLGFTPAIIALLGSDAENERFIADLRTKARSNLIISPPKTRMRNLPVMYNACFGQGSDLHECMSIIAENKTEDIEYVEAVLSEFSDEQNGIYSLNLSKVEGKLDSAWNAANSKSSFKLEYDARDQALRQFTNRLTVMLTWVERINSTQNSSTDITWLASLKNEIAKLIQTIQKKTRWRNRPYANVLTWLLSQMEDYLNGHAAMLSTFSDLLYSGVFSLQDDGIPDIDKSLTSVKYFEPWRNALRHIVTEKKDLAAIRAEILNDDLGDESGLVDNLRQLEMLGKFSGADSDAYTISAVQLKEATASAEERTSKFKETLELAYTYNQISETEKESLSGLVAQYKNAFFEARDFACWRRFLEALEKQIEEYADVRMKRLRAELDTRLSKVPNSPLLREADRMLEQDKNYAVTEEYINRFDVGETELDDEVDAILHDPDYFSDFLAPDTFDPLFDECRRCSGRALKSFGWSFIEKRLPHEWTTRLRDDSEKMVSNWPSRKDSALPAQIQRLFSSIGFNVNKVTKVLGRKEEMFKLQVKASARGMADYRHPISAFGTQMKSPLNVIVLYGNYTERQLVDTVSSLDLGGISIVLIDRPIDKSARRLIGEIFHNQTSGQNPFLLIDQVLFLYLAMHQITERIPAMLKCTLPYTTYQPFVRDGGSTADEMFYGRTQELATIMDPNGASVVYGGRQLGKTALLERAESRCSKPDDKAFAVYINIINCRSERELVDKIIGDVQKKTGISLTSCKSLDKLCAQIDGLFRERKVVSILLLLDEADNFLAAIADTGYKPIQPLIDLKRETRNSFKFVIAGLHNVCRAKNATEENGVFGQLGTPLCIKPLAPTDALQLLSRPLRYLGFQIDRYPHLEIILTNTNYYPGILQFFGYMLVETLNNQYARYYRAAAGNPPFILQDEQLAAVMTSSDINRSIRDKFRWSLELDQRYFMLARCITILYHFYEDDRSSGSWLGFSVDEIMSMAHDYDIHCLKYETRIGYINLLDEMVEMGILNQPVAEIYRLRRSSFVDIIGENFEKLDEEIRSNNEEVC